MKTKLLILAVALSCAFSGGSFAMTKAEYTTQKDSIAGDYKVSRDKCNGLKANAKDICVSEAKGVRKIAKAEMEAAYEPSARHTEKLAMAKGDAAYDTAKEKCDDSSGNAKTICRKDAKAAHVKANDEARVLRVSAESGKLNTAVRNMATKDENEANYKAATARCDSLMGAAKDTCTSDAKVKFGMKWLSACRDSSTEQAPQTFTAFMTKLLSKDRNELPAIEFAFQAQRKEPLENASHIRNAIARFNQVTGVNDAERTVAWHRILGAAKRSGVNVHDTSWRDLGKSAS